MDHSFQYRDTCWRKSCHAFHVAGFSQLAVLIIVDVYYNSTEVIKFTKTVTIETNDVCTLLLLLKMCTLW